MVPVCMCLREAQLGSEWGAFPAAMWRQVLFSRLYSSFRSFPSRLFSPPRCNWDAASFGPFLTLPLWTSLLFMSSLKALCRFLNRNGSYKDVAYGTCPECGCPAGPTALCPRRLLMHLQEVLLPAVYKAFDSRGLASCKGSMWLITIVSV